MTIRPYKRFARNIGVRVKIGFIFTSLIHVCCDLPAKRLQNL
jgi:hypothetical protein